MLFRLLCLELLIPPVLNMELSFNRSAHSPMDPSTNFSNATVSAVSEQLNKAANLVSIFVVCETMVSLGCTMNISKIKAHIMKPKGVALAILAQFGVMPLTAFSLAKLFQLGTAQAMAVLVCGCSPGGVLSNVLAYAFKGDMNLRYSSAVRRVYTKSLHWSANRHLADITHFHTPQ